MGIFRFRYIDHSLDKKRPGVRKRIEESRKRFQCDLLEFWRRCGPRCRQNRRCSGNPYACFRRNHAAMPQDHKHWRQAMVLAGATGTGTAEQVLRAHNLSLPRKRPPESTNPPHPPQAVAARPTPVPEHKEPVLVTGRKEDKNDRTRVEAAILSRLSPEGIASLEKSLRSIGQSLPPGFGSGRSSPPPSRRAEGVASVAIPKGVSPSSIEAFNERASKGMDYDDVVARLRALGASV